MSDGWVIAGTVAQFLSLVTIFFAVLDVLARRRRITVALFAHAWAIATHERGDKFVVVDIVNAGGEIAVLESVQIVNGTIVPNPEFPILPSIAAGGTIRIWVDAPNVLEVWFRFIWVTPKDGRFLYAAWRPMINGDQSEIAKKWAASNLRRPRRTIFNSFLLDRRPRQVDPDHHAFGRIRVSWNESWQAARRDRLVPQVDGQMPQWRLGLMDPRIPQ